MLPPSAEVDGPAPLGDPLLGPREAKELHGLLGAAVERLDNADSPTSPARWDQAGSRSNPRSRR